MWVFLNNSFISVVSDRNNEDYLLVRARRSGDIERALDRDGLIVTMDTSADYLFRAIIHRDAFASSLKSHVTNIDYDNFKDSVQDPDLHFSYLNVWSEMLKLQPVYPTGFRIL